MTDPAQEKTAVVSVRGTSEVDAKLAIGLGHTSLKEILLGTAFLPEIKSLCISRSDSGQLARFGEPLGEVCARTPPSAEPHSRHPDLSSRADPAVHPVLAR